jgi:four helix bundle protein
MQGGLETLKVYKLAMRLEIFVHRVLDEKFPADEKYRSINQLKRSSSSVADNIAESYGKFSYGAKINSLFIARGEVEETKSGILRAYKKKFISQELSDFIINKYTDLQKQLNGYIRYLKNKRKFKQPLST